MQSSLSRQAHGPSSLLSKKKKKKKTVDLSTKDILQVLCWWPSGHYLTSQVVNMMFVPVRFEMLTFGFTKIDQKSIECDHWQCWRVRMSEEPRFFLIKTTSCTCCVDFDHRVGRCTTKAGANPWTMRPISFLGWQRNGLDKGDDVATSLQK